MVCLGLLKDLKANMILLVQHIARLHIFCTRNGCRLTNYQIISNNVIAVIGDGAMSAGMAYEAMNNAGASKQK